MWSAPGGAGCENKACLTQPDWCLLMRPQPTPPWCGFAAAARVAFGSTHHVPHGHWKTITFIAGLRCRAMVAPFVLDGPMNSTSFMAYLKRCLVPTLKRGDIVMMDSLPVHKAAGVREVIEAAGAKLRYLPKYSPDLNPIEMAFSKLKAHLQKQPSEPFRISHAGSALSWPRSVRMCAPITSDMQATLPRDRNPL